MHSRIGLGGGGAAMASRSAAEHGEKDSWEDEEVDGAQHDSTNSVPPNASQTVGPDGTNVPNGGVKQNSDSGLRASALSFNPAAKSFTPSSGTAKQADAHTDDEGDGETVPSQHQYDHHTDPPKQSQQAVGTQAQQQQQQQQQQQEQQQQQQDEQDQQQQQEQQARANTKSANGYEQANANASSASSSAGSATASASASGSTSTAGGAGKATREKEEKAKQEERLRQELEAIENEDTRPHVNIVFIGHVDAGKSTVGGQILFRTGMVDDRTISKYEKEAQEKNRESWYMAYVMDINDEERNKGKTVEVGRANFATQKKRYSILDAPGHKNYVPNMIHGASQADLGVLVIAARRGEFETGFERGGQTREHAQLAKTLGVTRLIVVVNKMDHSSVQWSKERYDEIVEKTTPFLKSCGYNPKRDVTFVPISGLTGENIIDKVSASTCSWYSGQSLLETLDNLELAEADPTKPFRMPVLEKYRDMGVMVIGKSEAGIVAKGDRLLVMPNKLTARVLTVWVDEEEMPRARPNENTRLKIEGIEEENVHSGFVLCHQDSTVPAVLEFDATLSLLELPEGKSIFTAGYKAVLHIHAATEECEITSLVAEVDPKTKKPKKGKCLFLKSNSLGRVRIRTDQAVCLERFKDYPQLGRFTLRDQGKTIAVGKVEKVRLFVLFFYPPILHSSPKS